MKRSITINIEKLIDKIEVHLSKEDNSEEISKKITDILIKGINSTVDSEKPNNDSIQKPIYTTEVNTVKLNVKTDTIEEALEVIAKELRKYPNGYQFHGSLIGFAKSELFVLPPDKGAITSCYRQKIKY